MIKYSPWVSHLHLYHLVLALRAEGPLIGQGIMVVSALVAVQSDGVARQLDDLDEVKESTGYRWPFIFYVFQL